MAKYVVGRRHVASHGPLQERTRRAVEHLRELTHEDFRNDDQKSLFRDLDEHVQAGGSTFETMSDEEALEVADQIVVLTSMVAASAYGEALQKAPYTSM